MKTAMTLFAVFLPITSAGPLATAEEPDSARNTLHLI
jgi:hypothetical protein